MPYAPGHNPNGATLRGNQGARGGAGSGWSACASTTPTSETWSLCSQQTDRFLDMPRGASNRLASTRNTQPGDQASVQTCASPREHRLRTCQLSSHDRSMDLQARAAALTASPKARWALAWLAAPVGELLPADFHTADTARPANTRLHLLRADEAALLAEVHNRVEDWRYQRDAHTAITTLGPAQGYHRVATALANAPAASWWWEPLRRDHQVWICDEPIERGKGLPFSTSYAHHWDATSPFAELITSTSLARLPAVALLSDQNCEPADRTPSEWLTAWRTPVRPDARVAEVHCPADWVSLVERYPSHRTNLCQAPDLHARWPDGELPGSVEWSRLARDYDGLHLSVAGWLTATSLPLPLPQLKRPSLTFCEGWPTEATVWFRPVFTGEFERIKPEDLDHKLEYGYGRPRTGSPHDLTCLPTPARVPWWRRWVPRRAS